MKTVHDLKVGDTIWYTDVNRKGLFEATVTKVGSKLITTEGGLRDKTFRKDTLKANDEYQHQTLIPDKETYLEDQEKCKIISEIAIHIRQIDRTKVSLASLHNVASILGIKID